VAQLVEPFHFHRVELLFTDPFIVLKILNVWMPVPLYLSGVVIIFAFPPLKVRDLRLDLGKNISFSDSLLERN